MSINALDQRTVKFLTTAQVITSVTTAVKELVENSIDAEASNIDVNLMDDGASLVEVSDDGKGITGPDTPFMALQSYTSKIKDFSDLDSLTSYGFRGEALSSLCRVAAVSIITRTRDEDAARSYTLTDEGGIRSCELCHHSVGTTVRAKALFKDLPVRRQIITSSAKRSSQEVKNLLRSYGICQPKIRMNLRVNGSNVMTKPSTTTHRETLVCLFSHKFVAQIDFAEEKMDDGATIRLTIPRKDATDFNEICQVGQHVFVNQRPVSYREIEKLISKRLVDHFGHKIPAKKKLAFILCLDVPPADLDVNLEPNKTSVLLTKLEKITEALDRVLVKFYDIDTYTGDPASSEKMAQVDTSSKLDATASFDYRDAAPGSNEISTVGGSSVGPPASKKRKLESDERELNPNMRTFGTFGSNDRNNENCLSSADETRQQRGTNESIDGIVENISQLPVVDLGEDFSIKDIAKLPNLDAAQVEKILRGTGGVDAFAKGTNDLTLEAWSKGQVPTNLRGGTDVCVYGNLEQNAETTEARVTSESDPNTTGCKGFLKFSKEMRPLIIEENPGINFVKVAKTLAQRWKELSSEERGYYRDLAADADATVSSQSRSQDAMSTGSSRSTKVPKVSSDTAEKNRKRLMDMLENMKNGLGKDSCIRKTIIPYTIDMNVVIEKFNSRRSNAPANRQQDLVLGAIDENLWIVRTGTQIWALGLTQLLQGLDLGTSNSIQKTRQCVEELVERWLREKDGMSVLHPVFDLR